jgi:hypothetical protein
MLPATGPSLFDGLRELRLGLLENDAGALD